MDNSSDEGYSPQEESDGVQDYGSMQYWENRYKKRSNERYDWLENYQSLQIIIQEQLNKDKDKKILNVGCGNGEIQDKLYEVGYHNIINNDFSKVVIEEMNKNKEEKGYQKMEYHIMDVTDMTYPSAQFDMVLDKSTIDALLCSDTPYVSTARMLQHIYRVLKNGGIYMVISYGSPDTRMPHLVREHVNFNVKITHVEKEMADGNKVIHFVYICEKVPMKDVKGPQEMKIFYEELEELEKEQFG